MKDEDDLVAELKEKYPPNSKKNDPEEKKVERIVTGEVTQKKKGFARKFKGAFLEDDTKSVTEYIIYDVMIPAAKAMISDVISGGIEMMLFGERRGRSGRTYRDGNRTYTNYNSISSPSRRERDMRELSRRGRARHDFDEIVIPSRGEAEEVLDQMVEMVSQYGEVCVADFYEMVGINSDFTDNKYGWTNLREAMVRRVRNGYIIDLPRAIPLDN